MGIRAVHQVRQVAGFSLVNEEGLKAMQKSPQIYQCLNAKVKGNKVYCAKGYNIGSISLKQLASGYRLDYDQLRPKTCIDCPDFDSMGEPLRVRHRGWDNPNLLTDKDKIQTVGA